MNNEVIDVTPEMVSEQGEINVMAEGTVYSVPTDKCINVCDNGEPCDPILGFCGIKIPESKYVHLETSNQTFFPLTETYIPLKDLVEQCGLESDRQGINNQSAIISSRIMKDSTTRNVEHKQGFHLKEQGTDAQFKVVGSNDRYTMVLLPKQARTTKFTKTEPGYYLNRAAAYDFVLRGSSKKCYEFRSEVCEFMLGQLRESHLDWLKGNR